MVGVSRSDKREPRRSRALPQPLFLLPLTFVLLSLASGQWTTQLRRSCLADSAAALRCIGTRCDEGHRAHDYLAGMVSALRESEARSSQIEHNLTAAAAGYRAAAVAARSSELAAGAARNACAAHAFELKAIAEAADRLAGNSSLDFRRAADERVALRRRADGADELLRAHDEGLRALERKLTETRQVLNDTSRTVATVKNEMASNLSSLADKVASLKASEQINTSQISELLIIANQLRVDLSQFNQTQQESEVRCKRRTLALSAELNLTKQSTEQLREEFRRLRNDHDRLISEARNMSAVIQACPSGWQRNGSWCYFLVTSWSASWNDSRGRCNMMAADLVTVPNSDVNAFLRAYIANYPGIASVWLGATDVD